MQLSDLQQRLLNDFQHEFPLSPHPYQIIADKLGVSEEEILSAFCELRDQQFISRIGPVIPPNQIGVSALVAMSVPQSELEWVAEVISAYPEVNHNYERDHQLNLWFVVIAADQDHLASTIVSIERETGFSALPLPMLDNFFIDLGFMMELGDD